MAVLAKMLETLRSEVRVLAYFSLLGFVLCTRGLQFDPVPYKVNYFNQTLDHFKYYTQPEFQSTFKQRYLYQDKWWNNNTGPIFFYSGNEGDVVEFWKATGFMFELAPKFGALVIFCEHRFYGESLPFGPTKSFEHPHVDLLTVEQALADFAIFLDWFRTDVINDPQRPVITFGGSYGGMLSAYLRFKYPNIVTGAIAASAPIYLAAALGSRKVFFEDVTRDFHDAGCDDHVRKAFQEMYRLKNQGKEGLKLISNSFNLCKPLKQSDEIHHLVGWIRNAFASIAMFDYPYRASGITSLPEYPVKCACQRLKDASDVMKGLALATKLYYGPNANCSDIWTEYVECSDPTGCGLGPSGKAWSYQACADFVMPDGTDNQTDMFPYLPFSLEQRSKFCRETWGINPGLQWTRVSLWGQNIKSASNIVFSNGNLDPWHRGGVLKSISESVIAVMIDGGAHHLDLRASNPKDPPSVIKARQIHTASIVKWLQMANRERH